MPIPSKHKTVQARIIEYAEEIGWTVVPREEAEANRGFDPQMPAKDRAKEALLYIDDLLDPKIRKIRTLRGSGWGPDLLRINDRNHSKLKS
jgi:type I restriction enzyme R subunit